MDDRSILKDQVAYYRARAGEYDEWYLRQGRYYRGDEHKRQWFAELDVLQSELERERPFGKCLELACGTGLWTACLARGAAGLTAIDAASETIEINRTKIGDAQVRYMIADLFEWRPTETYDFIFFGFWLSHVPAWQFQSVLGDGSRSVKAGWQGFFRRQPGNPRVDRTGPPRTQRFRSRRKEAERWPDFQCGKSIPRPGSVEPAAARSWLEWLDSKKRAVLLLRLRGADRSRPASR